jgi:lipoprotein-releasing system permease protein
VPGLEDAGRGLVEAGLLLAVAAAAVTSLVGSSLGYMLRGAGRFDGSLSYERFVARNHLALTPRTLAGLLLLAATAVLPGLVLALLGSFRRELRRRSAARRGEGTARARMPATRLMTLISVGGVAIGVWALTVVLSVMRGYEGELKAKILGTRSHGVLLKYGDQDFTEWPALRERLLLVPGVLGATPFLYSEVMVSAGQNLTGAALEGIDPRLVGTVVDLPGVVTRGVLEHLDHPERIPLPGGPGGAAAAEPALPGIAIGTEMAKQLRVSVGDPVHVISPLAAVRSGGGQPPMVRFRVAALFHTGMSEYDSKFAYVGLRAAQRFLGAGDSVTGLEVKVHDVDEARAVLRRALHALGGYPYRVRSWSELNANLFSALMTQKLVMGVILSFIVLVASFMIVATLIMQVLEKRHEIAVLQSMGATAPGLMKIFVLQGLVIGGLGTGLGLLLGLGSCLLVERVGIPLDPQVYYISRLPARMNPLDFVLVALIAVMLSYLATIYPARKASRLSPVEGLRAE